MKLRYVFLALAWVFAAPAHAALSVFACEPEWAALATEIGGERVEAYAATTASQDPHRIEARPSLIARARRAQLLACTGADLEAGWLPLLLRQAANPAIRPGQPGHFLAAEFVTMREVPASVDRSAGDVHPYGNPHIHLDPRNIRAVAVAMGARLAAIDAANAAHYDGRTREFLARWDAATARWTEAAAPLRDLAFVADHQGWTYLAHWLGLRQVATLEPRPGLPASAAHLADVLARLKATPARLIVRAEYQDGRPAQWLAGQTGLPVVTLPFTVGGSGTRDLFGLFDETVRLLGATRP